jgi:transaldolase
MTKLQLLHAEHCQSPWLDNLTRAQLHNGELASLIGHGIRGITSNPTIFAKAITGSHDYDDQICALFAAGASPTDAYWAVVLTDIDHALAQLHHIWVASDGEDGYVSVELAPDLAHDTRRSIEAARAIHERIHEPNLMVKIPATPEGVDAVRELTAEGRSINVTLLFGLERHAQIIEAYLDGLEACPGDLSRVHSVASFFLSRVDTEVDARLERIGSPQALALRGRAALAQANAAYHLFRLRFSEPRWDALAARGARVQRPLWSSTSTKNPSYPDTMYVDRLIAPETVTTLTEATIAAFESHGTVARSIEDWTDEGFRTLEELAVVGIDIRDVSARLESDGIAAFAHSFEQLLETFRRQRPGTGTEMSASR